MNGGKRLRLHIGTFWTTILTILICYLLIKYAIPYLSMIILKKEHPLPVPAALMLIYMTLVFLGAFLYLTTDEEKMREVTKPVLAFLKGEGGRALKGSRIAVLALFPFLLGAGVYWREAPRVQSPQGIRVQHPTIPGRYENMVNPFRNPDDATATQFMEENGLKGVGLQEARQALVEKAMEEGRILYQMNCRPCHGSKADGNGPMAWGFRLRPANFRDLGTIATVVEQFAFWRIREGGRGLPAEATPWDSAMPRWMDELTDEEIWKIIMAEYDTAGVEPRKPEKLE